VGTDREAEREVDGRATVFVSNVAADHHYESVARYGAMRPVTQGNYPIFKTVRLTEEIITALIESKQTDYLALSGSGFVAALCLLIWMTLHKECNVLLYDPRQNSYVPRRLKRSEIIVQIEQLRDRAAANG
jgi:hypothetical protein